MRPFGNPRRRAARGRGAAAGESGTHTATDRDAGLRSLARLIDQTLPHASFGKLIGVADGEVTAIVCSDKGAGRGLIEALRRNGFARRATNGSAADVGVSRDIIDIGRLPAAVEEARLAAEFTTPARPLMHFSDIDLAEYLVRRADEAAFRLVPDWARLLDGADTQSHELGRTIRAFADCNLNVKRTARRIGVHTNTVYFRLNRIKKLTDVRSANLFRDIIPAHRAAAAGDRRETQPPALARLFRKPPFRPRSSSELDPSALIRISGDRAHASTDSADARLARCRRQIASSAHLSTWTSRLITCRLGKPQ